MLKIAEESDLGEQETSKGLQKGRIYLSSIYEKILGNSYKNLHPKLQHRYRLTEQKGFIGKGIMDEISGGSFLVRPIFTLGTKYRIFFAERGNQIPFKIVNKVTIDKKGKQIVHWDRTFRFKEKSRYFDAIMFLNERGDELFDYFGKPPLLGSTLSLTVNQNGSMQISSKKQWLNLLGKKIPLPKFLHGVASISESYDEGEQCYRITVEVKNPLVGRLFYYRGKFTEVEREN